MRVSSFSAFGSFYIQAVKIPSRMPYREERDFVRRGVAGRSFITQFSTVGGRSKSGIPGA